MEKIEPLSIQRLSVSVPIIERVPDPVTIPLQHPVVDYLQKPVVDIPNPTINYPVIPYFPRPQRMDSPPGGIPQDGGPKKASPPKKPEMPVILERPQTPAIATEIAPVGQNVVTVAGHEIVVPAVKDVVQASVTAVLGTTATLATAVVFNQTRRIIGEHIAKATRNKFKIKLKTAKPVLHFIHENDGVTVVEYSATGVKTLATSVQSPEQYLRDLVETDEFFELSNKIIIDEPVKEMFSREGAKRFNYFAPPRKLARRLSARFTFG